MERILKTFCILTVVFFVAITVGSVADQDAYAGGGIDYQVTVKNDTKRMFTVWLYVSKFVNVQHEFKQIQPGQSYTFHTGALCPSGLWARTDYEAEGLLFTIELYYKLLGAKVMSSDDFTACCWSSSWRIVPDGKTFKVLKN